MCTISGFWFREQLNIKYLSNLLSFGKLRGTDGIGISKIDLSKEKYNKNEITTFVYKNKDINKVDEIIEKLDHSSIIPNTNNILYLSNHRSAPETEVSVSDELRTLQPIYNKDLGIILVHNGSVSNFIVNNMNTDPHYFRVSKIDSEGIIWAYKKSLCNIRKTMEFLSGGFSFIMYDETKKKIYVVCSHIPLYCGYVRGCGMFWSSDQNAIWSTISKIKGTPITRNNIVVWEDYYCREVSEYTIEEIDVDSGCINEFKFEPRYIHPKWDPYIQKDKNKTKKVLVACSGGLDSTTTLAILKEAEYDCTAIHFKYGHRGEECEEKAIQNITKTLDIPLLTFEIPIIKQLDSGILTNKDSDIQTGTHEKTKTTYAWTVFRNHLFETYMGAIAESEVIKNNYENVFLAGGFLQLSESGSFPDNSERFAKAAEKFFKFSITGTRIKHLFTLCNLLKWEQFVLLDKLGLINLSRFFISCDRPKMVNGVPSNCEFFNKKSDQYEPACGSGRRSWYSSKIAGVPNLYEYFTISEEESINYIPYELRQTKLNKYKIDEIIDKILIHDEAKEILRKKLNCK